MAKPGEIIENPITGERIIFVRTASETNGEVMQADVFIRPHGFVTSEHIHPLQEERFEVTKGTIRFRLNEKEADATAGQVVVIPPGTLHSWWNPGEEEAAAHFEFRPALNAEAFLETIFGLVRDGKTDKQGRPGLLQMAVILPAYKDMFQLPLPWPLKVLFVVVAPLGRLLGYQASYTRYSATDRSFTQAEKAAKKGERTHAH
jgi:quercetin dioxygenase-like cupin family protein